MTTLGIFAGAGGRGSDRNKHVILIVRRGVVEVAGASCRRVLDVGGTSEGVVGGGDVGNVADLACGSVVGDGGPERQSDIVIKLCN